MTVVAVTAVEADVAFEVRVVVTVDVTVTGPGGEMEFEYAVFMTEVPPKPPMQYREPEYTRQLSSPIAVG